MTSIRTNLTVEEAVNKIHSAAKERRLVLFIGAGASRNAGYPDWKTLLNPVAEKWGDTYDNINRNVRTAWTMV